MSQFFRKLVLSLSALTIVVVLSYWWLQRRTSSAASDIAAALPAKVVGRAERIETGSSSGLGALRDESPRTKELKRLKRKWADYYRENPPSGINTIEQKALEKESVEALLCSEELLELIEFLKKYLRNPRRRFDWAVEELFRSPRAAEAREMLASLPADNVGIPPRQHWSFGAGLGCPEEEFESFCESLQDGRAAQNAVFGRSMALVSTDPAAAVSLTVEALENEVPSTMKPNSLQRLLADLPSDTDFDELEQLLPPDSSEGDRSAPRGPVRWGREELLRSWARIDPRAAANHVISNPDRIYPLGIRTIATEAAKANPAAAVEWAQDFPEGPYFDRAVEGVLTPAMNMRYPEQARELASMIGDPEIRADCLRRIASAGKSDAR